MQRTRFDTMPCPIARALERVGEWWTMLILREALAGATLFDQFQRQLPIAPNMLTRRLRAMVDAGLLERRPYSTRPVRHEYVLTDVGRDVRPVLVALMSWGNRHFAPEGASVFLRDVTSGEEAEPVMVDRRTGAPITPERHRFAAGPRADVRLRAKFEGRDGNRVPRTAVTRPPTLPRRGRTRNVR